MFNRFGFRLISAFGLVIAIATLVTVLLARQGTATQFAHFMVDHAMVRPARMQATLADFYRSQGSWDGLDAALDELIRAASDGGMGGMMGGMMGMYNNHMQVIDAQGRVVADSLGPPDSIRLLVGDTVYIWPVIVDNTVEGQLFVKGGLMGAHGMDDSLLLRGVTRAVWVAGALAALVALLLAGIIVGQITRPLAALTRASGRIAAGDLDVRVPVQSRDELGELASTFNRMADSLQTHARLRRNLVADIAHELRTPLAGIQGTVEAMQDGVFPPTPDNLATIHEEVILLNRLVEDLRLLANADAGQLHLEHAAVDLGELCRREVAGFQALAHSQGVTLQFEGAPALLPVCGDEQRLGQVLKNLIDNALRHTPRGGHVTVAACAAAPGGSVTVTDSGAGIASKDAARIFDRFYRADPARDRATGGTGLGLAIARQLVEAHGGRIWVHSPPPGRDHGSEFGIWLPPMIDAADA
jgi:signal transduction histidine kinase